MLTVLTKGIHCEPGGPVRRIPSSMPTAYWLFSQLARVVHVQVLPPLCGVTGCCKETQHLERPRSQEKLTKQSVAARHKLFLLIRATVCFLYLCVGIYIYMCTVCAGVCAEYLVQARG